MDERRAEVQRTTTETDNSDCVFSVFTAGVRQPKVAENLLDWILDYLT